MSDYLDGLFDRLRDTPPPEPFAPAAAVRRRGRKRTLRQAASVGIAVLAVTGLGAASLVTIGQPDPPTPPAATRPDPSTPGLTAVSLSWLLSRDDLSGDGWQASAGELVEGEWYWSGVEQWCPEYQIEDYPSTRLRLDWKIIGWERPGIDRVDQVVELFQPGAGAANMADVRAVVGRCSRQPSRYDVASTDLQIRAVGFASSDESILIWATEYQFNEDDQVVPAGSSHYVAVVRVGDVVTTIRYGGPEEIARGLARRAADRLR